MISLLPCTCTDSPIISPYELSCTKANVPSVMQVQEAGIVNNNITFSIFVLISERPPASDRSSGSALSARLRSLGRPQLASGSLAVLSWGVVRWLRPVRWIYSTAL